MATLLPIVVLIDKQFYVDERLQEYRNIYNPNEHYSFAEMDILIDLKEILDNPEEAGIDKDSVECIAFLEEKQKEYDSKLREDKIMEAKMRKLLAAEVKR